MLPLPSGNDFIGRVERGHEGVTEVVIDHVKYPVANRDGPDGPGEVLVANLHREAMPLLNQAFNAVDEPLRSFDVVSLFNSECRVLAHGFWRYLGPNV